MSRHRVRTGRRVAATCAFACVLGFGGRSHAQLAPQDVVGLVLIGIEKNYSPIHSYRAMTKEVLLDPTVKEKTVTKGKVGNGTMEMTQQPRSVFRGDLAVSGGNCRFRISGDDTQLLVIRDGRAVQQSYSTNMTQGRYIPENYGWFSNYDLREQGLLEGADRLKLLLTKNYVDSAVLEPTPEGGLEARITIARPRENPVTIVADAARNFLPSRIYYYYNDDITAKVVIDYERVPGLKRSWFLKCCKKYFSGDKKIREPDSPEWESGCQTVELSVVELKVNVDVPRSLFELPKPKIDMSISDADTKSGYIYTGKPR
jgi:hypothetical protein